MRAPIRTFIVTLTRVGAALVALTGVGTAAALAQSANWSTAATSGGSWGTPSNWQGGVVPSGSGNTAGFALNFTPGASVTLDGSRIIGTVNSSGANPWSLDPGTGGPLTVADFIVSGGSLTVGTPLTGVDLAKDGAGTLILSNGSSNYSGAININAGTLSLVGSGNYSSGSNAVHLASGATLDVTGLTSGLRYGGDPTTRMGVNNGDTVDGVGTVNGGLKVSAGGTVYPGINGVGSLSVKGAGNFDGGSNWKVKLSTANPGTSNVSNNIAFNASLKLADGVNMPIDGSGLTFTAGQTYDFTIASGVSNFTIGALNFQPSNFNPATLATAGSFSLITNGGNLILQFTPVPEPAFILATCFGAAACASVLRRRRVRPDPLPTAPLSRMG